MNIILLKKLPIVIMSVSITLLFFNILFTQEVQEPLIDFRGDAFSVNEAVVKYSDGELKDVELPGNVNTNQPFSMIYDLSDVPVKDLEAVSLHTTYLAFKVFADEVEIYDYNGSSNPSLKSGGYSFHVVNLPENLINKKLRVDFRPIIKEKNVNVYNMQKMLVGEPLNIFFTLLWERDFALFVLVIVILIIGVVSLILAALSKFEKGSKSFLRMGIMCVIFGLYFIPQIFVSNFFFIKHRLFFYFLDYMNFNLLPIALYSFVRGKLSDKFNKIIETFYHFSIFYLVFQIFMVLVFNVEFRVFLKFTLFFMMFESMMVLLFYILTDSKKTESKKEITKSTVIILILSVVASATSFFTENFFGTRIFTLPIYVLLTFQIYVHGKDFLKLQEEYIQKETYKKMAMKDTLTGLGSRLAYDKFINDNSNNKFWILSMDLNDLKKVNDTFGHLAGDTLIMNFSNLLKTVLSENASLFRVGGDEFIAFLSLDEDDDIQILVDKMREMAQNAGGEYSLSFAAGYAFYAGSGEKDLKEVLVFADNLMYHNKKMIKSKRKFFEQNNPQYLNEFGKI